MQMNQAESVPGPIIQPPCPAPADQPRRKTATILLVEDETLVREAMCEALVWAGFRVQKARDGAEARAIFRRCRKSLELLLIDVVLPDENGEDLACDLRIGSRGLHVILISGYPERVPNGQYGQRGTYYLPKPFSAESLVRRVRAALREETTDIEVGNPLADCDALPSYHRTL
jgi:two-component system, cell cycle sensor histidine kinase and response regulator CckA